MHDVNHLLEHEIKDIYDAEERIVEALTEVVETTRHPELKSLLQTHLEETEEQVKRLEKVFEALEIEEDEDQECAGMAGLLEERENFLEEEPAPAILDLFTVGAAKKIEHYEISAYRDLISLAKQAGEDEVVSLLEETLAEEEEALAKLEEVESAVVEATEREAQTASSR